jgi:hypothetical protein
MPLDILGGGKKSGPDKAGSEMEDERMGVEVGGPVPRPRQGTERFGTHSKSPYSPEKKAADFGHPTLLRISQQLLIKSR